MIKIFSFQRYHIMKSIHNFIPHLVRLELSSNKQSVFFWTRQIKQSDPNLSWNWVIKKTYLAAVTKSRVEDISEASSKDRAFGKAFNWDKLVWLGNVRLSWLYQTSSTINNPYSNYKLNKCSSWLKPKPSAKV